jgi:hypothetical protein
MNSFSDIKFTSHNKTNGHVSKYDIAITSTIEIHNGDKLVFTIPDIMSIPQEVSCIPGASGVVMVSCTNNGDTVYVTLTEVNQTIGLF